MNSNTTWLERADLDLDGKDESIATLELAPVPAGARGVTIQQITCVFRGTQPGLADMNFSPAGLWFSLVTFDQLHHVLGDTEARRQFLVEHRPEGDFLQIHDVSSANDGGDARSRFMQPRYSRDYSMRVDELPKGRAYPLNLPDERR